jgi:hypothetical protein
MKQRGPDPDLTTSVASDILTGRWEVALEELNTLQEIIDSRSSATLLATASAAANNLPDRPATLPDMACPLVAFHLFQLSPRADFTSRNFSFANLPQHDPDILSLDSSLPYGGGYSLS